MPEIEDLVNYAILVAVVAGVLLMVTGKFLDLTVERQTSTQTRATINILQKVVSEGDFLMTNSVGERLKLMVDRTKLAASNLEDCCQSLQYDYRFSVGQYKGEKDRKTIEIGAISGPLTNYDGELDYDRGSHCYYDFGVGRKSAADVPVNICDGDPNKCEQGVAQLETENSPLSELAYWITQACNFNQDLSKRIPLSDKDYQRGDDVSIKGDKVCFRGACKRFSCQEGTEVMEDYEDGLIDSQISSFPPRYCDIVRVVSIPPTEFVNNVRVIVYEGLKDVVPIEGAKDLPEDHDAWTEGDVIKDIFSVKETGTGITTENIIEDGAPVPGSADMTDSKSYAVMIPDTGIRSDLHDKAMYLNIDGVSDAFDLKFDCDDGNCIDMKSRNFYEVKFKARIYSDATNAYGLLTWKLYDNNGGCIEKINSDKPISLEEGVTFGEGKFRVSEKWESYTIRRLDSSQMKNEYASCLPRSGLPLPKSVESFNWKITSVEWNVCDANVGVGDASEAFIEPTCTLDVINNIGDWFSRFGVKLPEGAIFKKDKITALAIDNFYFKVADDL